MPFKLNASHCLALSLLLLFFSAAASESVSHAAEKIPDSIISISSGYVVAVDKKTQKLYVFKKNGGFSRVFEAGCSTGKNHGSKQVSGDARTPTGVFLQRKSSPIRDRPKHTEPWPFRWIIRPLRIERRERTEPTSGSTAQPNRSLLFKPTDALS